MPGHVVVRLASDVGKGEIDEPARRQPLVQDHLVDALPEHRARQRVVEVVEMITERSQRRLVEVGPDVVPVAMVRVDEIGAAFADRRPDFRTLARIGHRHEPDGDRAILEVVETQLRPVRAQRRPGSRRRLEDRHATDHAA